MNTAWPRLRRLFFDADPKTFHRFHFGPMASKDGDLEIDWKSYLSDITILSDRGAEISSNLLNLGEFTQIIDMNIEFVNAMGAEQLPVFVIDGAVKIDDFKKEKFSTLIENTVKKRQSEIENE
jgi:hypothetical protein